jgi:hypothetical protein
MNSPTAKRRYISFLDILGFRDFITRTPLEQATSRMGHIFSFLPFVESLFKIQETNGVAGPDPSHRSVYRFSFSDSFVLATADDSRNSLNTIIVATAILTRMLFGSSLPARGAIVCGEADFVSGSDHMIGTGIVKAVDLEKEQQWFGVALATEIGSISGLLQQLHPRVRPFVAQYDVPLKTGVMKNAAVINWRCNLFSQTGVKALLPSPTNPSTEIKHANTLRFARYIRDTNQDRTPHDAFWLAPYIVAKPNAAAAGPEFELAHGDEF